MKKILLTGPTGSVGIETLKELIRTKDLYEIVVFDKESELSKEVLEPYKNDIKIVYGDIRDRNTIIPAVKDVDFVIHLAAVIPPLADHNTKLAEEVNVGGTRNLIECIKEHSKDAFILYASSVSVYGDRLVGEDIHVDDKLKPSVGDYYAETKIAAEKIVQESGLRHSIFRLSGVMGPRPGEDKSKIDPLFFHMPLNTKIEIVTTRDAGYALVKAIENQDVLNKNIYNLAGGIKCRVVYIDFLKHTFDRIGINIKHFPKYSFAEQNFHCGYYKDSHILNDILQFQRDTMQSYYKWIDTRVNPLTKFITSLFSKTIAKKLAKESDVWNAVKNNDLELIKRFLKDKPIIE